MKMIIEWTDHNALAVKIVDRADPILHLKGVEERWTKGQE